MRCKTLFDKGIEKAQKAGCGNEKFVSYVNKISTTMLGEETGNKISDYITKSMGVNSASGLATAAVAGVIGRTIADPIGDAYENIKDSAQIRDLVNNYNDFQKVHYCHQG